VFDEKVDVAEIMEQIKQEVKLNDGIEELVAPDLLPAAQDNREILYMISQSTRMIRETREKLHDSRNIGHMVPRYEKFPVPVRQFFRLLSRITRKAIQFVIQDQVDVNSQVDSILGEMEKREALILRLILQNTGVNGTQPEPEASPKETE